jgi:hypothetical protein
MAIHVHCACGKRFVLDDVHLGRRLRCKQCGRKHRLEPAADRHGHPWGTALAGVLLGLLLVAGFGMALWKFRPTLVVAPAVATEAASAPAVTGDENAAAPGSTPASPARFACSPSGASR